MIWKFTCFLYFSSIMFALCCDITIFHSVQYRKPQWCKVTFHICIHINCFLSKSKHVWKLYARPPLYCGLSNRWYWINIFHLISACKHNDDEEQCQLLPSTACIFWGTISDQSMRALMCWRKYVLFPCRQLTHWRIYAQGIPPLSLHPRGTRENQPRHKKN